jgi:hypothetical protein
VTFSYEEKVTILFHAQHCNYEDAFREKIVKVSLKSSLIVTTTQEAFRSEKEQQQPLWEELEKKKVEDCVLQ